MQQTILSENDLANSVILDLNSDIRPAFLKAALSIEKTLHENGFHAFLVGGSVRDLLLKRRLSDLDYTTNAIPGMVKKLFKKVIPVGEEFGTVIVLIGSIPIEITTYRTDGNYEDGRRPTSISFGKELQEDVMRRDFSINGMAYSVTSKRLIDYTNGVNDLKKKIIRTIGDPTKRFDEDGLRPIRGCRIMSNLGFTMDPDTEAAISDKLKVIQRVAPERFYDEWRKTLNIKAKDVYWNILKKTGIFELFFSDFEHLNNSQENWDDLILAIQHSRPRNMAVYIAHFIYFEWHTKNKMSLDISATITAFIKKFFRQNRFPAKTENLCKELLFTELLKVFEASITDKPDDKIDKYSFKLALSKIPKKNWFYHIRFCKEIILSKLRHEDKEALYGRVGMQTVSLLRTIARNKEPLYISDLNISGNELLKIGCEGKQIGTVLAKLQTMVIRDPEVNVASMLLQNASKLKDES